MQVVPYIRISVKDRGTVSSRVIPMVAYQRRDFPTVLRELRARSGKSIYRLAQYCELTEAYLGRLETGERRNPTRDTVMKIGLALVQDNAEVTIHDVQELLLAAGFAPLLGRGETITVD